MNSEGAFHFLEDTDTPVRNLQKWLRVLSRTDPNLPEIFIDGIYGKETKDAVMAIQKQNGLPVTGETDLDTFNIIYNAYEKNVGDFEMMGYVPDFNNYKDNRISFGDEFDDIFVLQALLNTIALDDKRFYVTPSGKYDGNTQSSVNLFRKATGREEGNFVDRTLWNDLIRYIKKPQYYT